MFSVLQKSFAVAAIAVVCMSGCGGSSAATTLPNPLVDAAKATDKRTATAVFAGGCFWGVDAVFKHVKGVSSVLSGYAGGAANTAHYEMVGSGMTGHAESVQVKYDPSQITYGQLLRVFFSVAHDPTELNRQGPDVGTQYRSAIFYADPEQQRIAQAYIEQLQSAKAYARPIVTQVTALNAFYPAEDYHQDYLARHPENMYIVINDLPKLNHLKQELPQLYVSR
ncbi:MAG TPA: peptide-methionine (S)-S-oxide reductase MsrA [Casimicrobiaceae bacterium]